MEDGQFLSARLCVCLHRKDLRMDRIRFQFVISGPSGLWLLVVVCCLLFVFLLFSCRVLLHVTCCALFVLSVYLFVCLFGWLAGWMCVCVCVCVCVIFLFYFCLVVVVVVVAEWVVQLRLVPCSQWTCV